MSKVKLRCTTCGKWFQSANAKEVTCPDCVQKARKEKLAAKTTPTANTTSGINSPTRPVPPPPTKPKPAEGTRWFDKVEDVKIGQPDTPPRPKLPPSPAPRDTRGPGGYRDRDDRGNSPSGYRGPGGYRDRDDRGPVPGGYRGPGGYRDRDERGSGSYRPGTLDTPGYRPRQPMEGGFNRVPRPGETRPNEKRDNKPPKPKAAKPQTPSKPRREKIPPPTPFVPTPEQVTQVEARYLELAVPAEFDGIRTQIATELSIPKKAVKKIVNDIRERNHILSWWETQVYKGDSEELAKIKAAYEPYLPVPAVGVHKKIADELELKAGIVYQAIKAIRLELNLPQFNDPSLHGEELIARKQKAAKASDAGETGETGDEAPKTAEAAAPESEASEASATTPAETAEAQAPVEVAASNASDEKSDAENS
ncbi:MAG: hypothetical protein ACRDIV_02200 [Ktedonobacteraceae bacterium]